MPARSASWHQLHKKLHKMPLMNMFHSLFFSGFLPSTEFFSSSSSSPFRIRNFMWIVLTFALEIHPNSGTFGKWIFFHMQFLRLHLIYDSDQSENATNRNLICYRNNNKGQRMFPIIFAPQNRKRTSWTRIRHSTRRESITAGHNNISPPKQKQIARNFYLQNFSDKTARIHKSFHNFFPPERMLKEWERVWA